MRVKRRMVIAVDEEIVIFWDGGGSPGINLLPMPKRCEACCNGTVTKKEVKQYHEKCRSIDHGKCIDAYS